ncbi:MAG: hypothetical protein ABW185_00540 [Sedimenticola sp.]
MPSVSRPGDSLSFARNVDQYTSLYQAKTDHVLKRLAPPGIALG